MKSLLFVAILLANTAAQAAPITAKRYVSFMNFGLHALSIDTNINGDVEVVVGGALLDYPDNGDMMNRKVHEDLGRVLELENLSGVRLTFPASACRQLADNTSILNCGSEFGKEVDVKVQGVRIDWWGKVTQVGPKIIVTRWADVGVVGIIEKSVDGEKTLLRGHLHISLEESPNKFLSVSLLKSNIGLDRR